MSKECIRIAKGGKLIETKWVCDKSETGEEGKYVDSDVTDQAIRRLMDNCELEEGVTLRDIFLLLNTELQIFDAIIGNWCEEIVTEGLTKPAKPYDLNDDEQIEFLELYWYTDYDDGSEYGPSFCGYSRPDFHGIGVARKNNSYFDWKNDDGTQAIEWKAGDRTPWGISFSSANDLIDIPVKLNTDFTILEGNTEKPIKQYGEVIAVYKGATYTLLNILHGILWEMSFHGGPEKRDVFSAGLRETVDKIKSGEMETVPMESVDEFFDNIKKDKKGDT